MNLARIFNREITYIYNPSYGVWFDLAECILGRNFDILGDVESAINLTLEQYLREKNCKKIIIVCHSQGTIITSNVMNDWVRKENPNLKKIEVYMFGSAARVMEQLTIEGEEYPYYENYANTGDIVTYLGIFSPQSQKKGRIFINKKNGHLLGAHYLPDLLKGNFREIEPGQNTPINYKTTTELEKKIKNQNPKQYLKNPDTEKWYTQYIALGIAVFVIVCMLAYLSWSLFCFPFCMSGSFFSLIYVFLPIGPNLHLLPN
jgi:hypothetical protein